MPAGVLKVLRDRDVGLYLGGVLVSAFGSTAMLLVCGMWVKDLTGSSALAGLTPFFAWLPTLFGPVLGVLADRMRRLPLLIRANAGMALLLPVLLAVRSGGWIWLLFAVLVVYGAAGAVADAAEAGVVAAGVPAELRGDFNGLRMSANEGMKLVAPLVGAALFARYGGAPVVLVDAATFALAAVAFALMCVREPDPARGSRPRVAEGIRFLRGSAGLRRLVAAGGVTMTLSGLSGSAVYAVVDAGLHRSPAFAGVLYTVQGVGSLLAGLVAGPLLRRLPERFFAGAGIAVFAVGVVLRAVPWPAAVLTGSGLIGLGLPCVLVAALTAVQREAPADLVGRVAGTANTLVFAPLTLSIPVGAGLVALVDHRMLLVGTGAAGVTTALWCALAGRRTRRPEAGTEPVPVPTGTSGSGG
ncbi:MFS transporter [Streptomyces sp. SCA3-4]|uniref:MFS transporter n=1 Tax=Streptomyces sichuanensis TaxID=2871810 RepID=UPI001CE32AAA|nr:MFS transporter [Streptomyces sichuanensis]MCA6093812.1 MFS transporter [Streptomyces sichuanensis]